MKSKTFLEILAVCEHYHTRLVTILSTLLMLTLFKGNGECLTCRLIVLFAIMFEKGTFYTSYTFGDKGIKQFNTAVQLQILIFLIANAVKLSFSIEILCSCIPDPLGELVLYIIIVQTLIAMFMWIVIYRYIGLSNITKNYFRACRRRLENMPFMETSFESNDK